MTDKIWIGDFTEDALIAADVGTWLRTIEIDSDTGVTEAAVRINKSSTYGPLLLILAGNASRSVLEHLHTHNLEHGFLVTVSFAGDAVTLLNTEPFQTLAEGVDEMIVEDTDPPILWRHFEDTRYRKASSINLGSEAMKSMKSLGLVAAAQNQQPAVTLKKRIA